MFLAFLPAFLVIVFSCTTCTSDASCSGGTGLGWMEEEEVVPHHHTVCELTNNIADKHASKANYILTTNNITFLVVCMCADVYL